MNTTEKLIDNEKNSQLDRKILTAIFSYMKQNLKQKLHVETNLKLVRNKMCKLNT